MAFPSVPPWALPALEAKVTEEGAFASPLSLGVLPNPQPFVGSAPID